MGWTPLMFAAWQGKTEVIKILLEHGVDVNCKTKYDWAPIDVCCRDGYEEIVSLLLEKGAPVNLKSTKGYTALGLAAHNGYLSIVKMLVNAGADFNSPDEEGNSPLDDAITQKHEGVVTYLLSNGAKGKPGVIINPEIKTKLTCKRCGKTILTKPQFIAELEEKHSIQVDPDNVDRLGSAGYLVDITLIMLQLTVSRPNTMKYRRNGRFNAKVAIILIVGNVF